MTLIEQYLPNISDLVYSVNQSFMWFLWLNWRRKSTFYPVTAPNDSKCWPIVTSSIQEPVASNYDVIMTGCSRVVAMDAFLAQCWGEWFYFVTPRVSAWGIASMCDWMKLRFWLYIELFSIEMNNELLWLSCKSAEALNVRQSMLPRCKYHFAKDQKHQTA